MKNKNLLLSLALALALTSCNTKQAPANPVSDETITAALDDNMEAVNETNDENTENTTETEEATEPTDPNAIDTDKWRRMIVDIGEFRDTVAKNLTDEQIEELVTDAREWSEKTGYWDVKDFVFQELGKLYPELSQKFPLESVEAKYYQQAATEGEISGKYEYERRVMADWGYPTGDVWNFTDAEIENAFHEAYALDEEAYYEDYLEKAAEILFGVEEEQEIEEATVTADSENAPATNTSKKQQLRRFGSSQIDYDALKTSLIQYYEFSPSSVNQMTNEEIDIAYTRAMDRLEETGFGDIGLIFEELGKMYPGASTMYPGE